jgi:hypothetical protein
MAMSDREILQVVRLLRIGGIASVFTTSVQFLTWTSLPTMFLLAIGLGSFND